MTQTPATLGEYLRAALIRRFGKSTVRTLSDGAGISVSTANALLNYTAEGNPRMRAPDPQTLQAVAAFLDLPPETLFRFANLLPEDNLRSRLVREIDRLFEHLPVEDQEEIAMLVRLKAMRHTERKD